MINLNSRTLSLDVKLGTTSLVAVCNAIREMGAVAGRCWAEDNGKEHSIPVVWEASGEASNVWEIAHEDAVKAIGEHTFRVAYRHGFIMAAKGHY